MRARKRRELKLLDTANRKKVPMVWAESCDFSRGLQTRNRGKSWKSGAYGPRSSGESEGFSPLWSSSMTYGIFNPNARTVSESKTVFPSFFNTTLKLPE